MLTQLYREEKTDTNPKPTCGTKGIAGENLPPKENTVSNNEF